MTGTTAGGWPYVTSTDEARLYPTTSLALANKLQAQPAAVTDHGALTGLADPDHPIAAVVGLQTALDGKAPTAHTHTLGDLPTTLATDADVAAAVTAHEAATDPHPGYLKPAEVLAGANITVDTTTTPGSVIIAGSGSGGGGSTILSGTATPTGATGNLGDYYLDTDDRVLYGPKGAGVASYNLLTINQASVETDTAGFVAESGVTIARSTSWAGHGTASLSVTGAAGFAAMVNLGTGTVAATAGQAYTWQVTGRVASGTLPFYLSVYWYNAALSLLGNAQSAAFTATTGGVVANYVTAAAPANTAWVKLRIDAGSGVVVGNVFYFDQFGFWPGTETVWVLPGGTVGLWPVALKSVPPGGTTGQVLKKTSNADYAVAWVT